jgi:hypothetical protein
VKFYFIFKFQFVQVFQPTNPSSFDIVNSSIPKFQPICSSFNLGVNQSNPHHCTQLCILFSSNPFPCFLRQKQYHGKIIFEDFYCKIGSTVPIWHRRHFVLLSSGEAVCRYLQLRGSTFLLFDLKITFCGEALEWLHSMIKM